jgi:signal transduction histidine kinase
VEVGTLVADAAAAVSRLFSDKEVGLIVDLPPHLPLVQADRDQLMQVVINLLSNAVKFCASGAGRVVISGRAGGGGVEIRVADNGPGIAREHIETIFERFSQVGASANSKPPGSGLGLPISRRIIEHFGGHIWAESKRGQGATFIFTLPATVTAAAMEAAK